MYKIIFNLFNRNYKSLLISNGKNFYFRLLKNLFK